jgi:Tfp pilus assembly protein PilO
MINNNAYKKKYSLFNLLFATIILIVIFSWTLPVWNEVGKLNQTLDSKKAELTKVEQDLEKVKGAQTSVAAETEVAQTRVLSAIPVSLEQDKLITQINNIARKNLVSINSISFSAAQSDSEETIKKASVSVSLTAEKKDLINFLKALENNPRKLLVKSITVQFGEIDGINRINFNISMDTYYQS